MVALSAEIPAILLRQRWLSKQLIPGARIRRYMELCQRANRFCSNKGAELVLGRLIAMPTIVGTVTLATAANELSNQLAVFELLHRAVLDEPSVLVGQGVNRRIRIVGTVNDFLGRKRNFLPIRLPVDAGYHEFCHFKYSPFSFLTVFLYIKVSIPNGR